MAYHSWNFDRAGYGFYWGRILVKMFQIEFYSGHTEIVFAESKRAAYGKALGMKAGRVVAVIEIVVN